MKSKCEKVENACRMEPTHWIMRIGNRKHFEGSKKYGTWGINSKRHDHFVRRARVGDVLWFMLQKSGGKMVAVGVFTHCRMREMGPLISADRTNEELGWTETNGVWDMLIYFKDLIDVESCKILTHPATGHCPGSFEYKATLCTENLPVIYPYIRRFVSAFAVPVVDEFACARLLSDPV